MPYGTNQDLIDSVGLDTLVQLTDDERTGSLNQARIDKAGRDADATINSYIGVRYGLPLEAPFPDKIVELWVDITVWNLYSRRPHIEMPETVKANHDLAISFLKDIASGKASLGIAPRAIDTSTARASKTVDDRIFKSEKLDNF